MSLKAKYALKDLLDKLEYEWEDNDDFVRELCALTKCRKEVGRNPGYESCHLFLALSKRIGPARFLEFGFGRGTTSILMALEPWIKAVETYDIVPLHQKRPTWCLHKDVAMSNYEFIEACELNFANEGSIDDKIQYYCYDTTTLDLPESKENDLAYIDGSHDFMPVLKDFKNCLRRMAKDSIIVMDDYNPEFGAYMAINHILKEHDGILVSTNGHIYGPKPESPNTGHIIIPFGKYKELLGL